MKITMKQLRRIIKEELENAMLGSDGSDSGFDIEWGEPNVSGNRVEYDVTIRQGENLVAATVTYIARRPGKIDAQIEGMTQIEGEEDLSDEVLGEMEAALEKEANSEKYMSAAQDDIDNNHHDEMDREESFRDPLKGMR